MRNLLLTASALLLVNGPAAADLDGTAAKYIELCTNPANAADRVKVLACDAYLDTVRFGNSRMPRWAWMVTLSFQSEICPRIARACPRDRDR